MNIKFFDLAKKISKLSDHRNHKLGSVIVRGSKVVSVGTNRVKTHPRSTHPFRSLHSEMAAILLAKQDLNDCEIYVYRETKEGIPALARPCVYCFPFIRESGIKKIHYSVAAGYKTEGSL
jgi:deoxycytidylate deaminase